MHHDDGLAQCGRCGQLQAVSYARDWVEVAVEVQEDTKGPHWYVSYLTMPSREAQSCRDWEEELDSGAQRV